MQAVGDAIGEMNTQFGLTGTELEKATEQMLKFAQINETDVTTSTQNAKAAIEAYNLSVQDLPSVLDAVTKAAQDTGLGVDQIYEAVIKGAPQIKAMNLDFATAAQLMGRFEQKGLDSSKALSYLARAQVNWAKDGKTMEQGLAELQKQLEGSSSETEKLTIASELFGTKGASFMLDAIERGALDFDTFSNSAANASGTVSTTFEGTLDPIDKATTAFNNLKIAGAEIATSLQTVLSPALDKIVTGLQNFSAWFSNLPPGIQQFIITVGLVVAAIGPLLIIFGQIATAIGALTPLIGILGTVFTALTGPIGIVVAAITGAIAIGIALYKNWDEIKTGLAIIFDAIKDKASKVFNSLVGIVKAPINTIIGLMNGMINALNRVKIPIPKIPDWVPVIGGKGGGSIGFNIPNIPQLATGAFVEAGNLFPAMVGEGRYDEAIIPLSDKVLGKLAEQLSRKLGAEQPVVNNINITNPKPVAADDSIRRELLRLQYLGVF
jgi:phage-related minor tail protein